MTLRTRGVTRRELLSLRRPPRGEDSGHWIRVHRTAMACRFEVTLSGEHAGHLAAAREALDEVDWLEDALTVFRDWSEVSRVNRDAGASPVRVSETLFALLAKSRALHEATEGAFDPTSAPLSRCWGFLARQGRLPATEDVAAALEVVGFDKVELDPGARTVYFRRPGVGLNFGSIGKGYALDCMAALLRRRGVPRALVSAGGSSLLAFGRGDGFRVDVRPRRTKALLARVSLAEAALGTSGAGEQFFEAGGRRYGHVLDPRTGWPAEGVLAASVVAPDAASADALSTAFLVGGSELAARYCAAHPGTTAVLAPEDEAAPALMLGTCEGAVVEVP